jgi:WD40 repeat protein
MSNLPIDFTQEKQQTSSPSTGWLSITEWSLLALMITYFGLHTFSAAWKTLNTDFPNYYLTARLAREGSNTSRIYEWIWLQRQKDHREINREIISLVPITPFSTLIVWPFAAMRPLDAKHCWLILNILFIVATTILLRWLVRFSWRRTALLVALSVPLNKNFLFGQYYVLLLFILTIACWCYINHKRFLSGFLIGFGFGVKLFPLLYLAYFLRKRDIRALAGGIVGGVSAGIISILVFGWQANRVLVEQVLPWTLRGEGMDPYNLSSGSIATLLHRLFIYEPQLNPNPTIHAVRIFAVLLPLAQTALFAPALLLTKPGCNPRRLQLEWSAILLGSLAISTLPAGYHFTLLILPVCLMLGAVQERALPTATAALLLLYIAIGYPGWKTIGEASRLTLFSVPRFYLVVLLCFFSYWLLAAQDRKAGISRDTWLWAAAFVFLMCLNIASGLRHQNGLYADYQWRIPTANAMLQANSPVTQNDTILFTAMLPAGYRTAIQNHDSIHFDSANMDQLAVTATSAERWTEEVSRESKIVSSTTSLELIRQAELPVASPDGRWLAYLREEHGRASLWIRALDRPETRDKILTPAEFNVLEMSFLPNGTVIFSAEVNNGYPELFLVDQSAAISSLDQSESRYPAISPDGHWFAYSKMQNGNWHLWLRDLQSGQTSRLTPADCNNVEPAWEPDSKTLVYASDCGRALWFSALCRRRVIE